MSLNWQQKAAALNALSPIKILMRGYRDWYVSQSVEVKGESVLTGAFGNGETPEIAIENHWEQLVDDLTPSQYLVVNAYQPDRQAVLWNGFMWADKRESTAEKGQVQK